jgi:hypothetical protein
MRFPINIISFFSLFFIGAGIAAAESFELNNKTIVGSTPITAQLSTSTYHSRALEDALRKLLANSANTVTGFTLVEDGKLLIDQIQSKTNVLIHEYKVMNVKQDARDYELEVNFLYSNTDTRQSSTRCVRLPITNISTNFVYQSSNSNLIPWAQLNAAIMSQKLSGLSFKPDVELQNLKQRQKSKNALYTLKKSSTARSIYELNITMNSRQLVDPNFLGKGSKIGVTVNIETLRNGTVVHSETQSEDFLIDYKTISNLSIIKSRKNWKQTEDEIYKSIAQMVEDHARVLKCISLKPNVALSSGKFILNFGSAEGINRKDLIIAQEENGREIFLEIATLNKHDAILKLISSVDDIQSINVDNVKILSGA